MISRRAMACLAAFFAVISVGALGYAVVWAFDFSAMTQPVAHAPETKREAGQETTAPATRRKPLIIAAPRVSGEDTRAVTTSAPHVAALSETVAAAPVRGTDKTSLLVVERPPPAPPTPGEDRPPIASSSRVSAASPALDRPMAVDRQVRSELVPQNEAKAAPVQAPLPDPEPTGAIGPPTVFRTKPRQTQQPVRRSPEDALTPPGITIIRGVPPVPGDSPAIVRPGPLIIHVPAGARR